MIINYSDDLNKQEFHLEPYEVENETNIDLKGSSQLFELDNPVVALDQERIYGDIRGSLAANYFIGVQNPVGTMYDGVNTYWFKFDGTWPATLDSLVQLRGQRNLASLSKAEKVLDLGCGTGIAGNYASQKNSNIKKIDFADIEPNCVKTAYININGSNFGISEKLSFSNNNRLDSNFLVSDGFQNINEKYDIILVGAVPAMPVYPGYTGEVNPLFQGTSFLEKLIRDSPEYLNKEGKLILSYPSMAEGEFQDFIKRYGVKETNELGFKELAFREDFLQDPLWVGYLIERGGLKVKDKINYGHKYWFDSKAKELSYD